MRFRAAALVALVLVLVASPLAAAPVHSGAAGGGEPTATPAFDRDPAAPAVGSRSATTHPNTTMVIETRADGDARWTVATYVELDGPNATAAFNEQAVAWRDGELDAGYDIELFRRFVRAADGASERDMRVPGDSVDRTAEVVDGGDRGVLRLSFTWTNFATRDGDRLIVRDAFRTQSGVWLDGLQRGQRLVIRPPDGFQFDAHPQGARLANGSLIWEGPASFPETYFLDQPVVFEADGRTSPPPSPPASDTASPDSPTPGDPAGPSRGLLFGIFAALVLGGGLALYRLAGDGDLPDGTPASADGPGDGDGDGDAPSTAGDAGAAGNAATDGHDEPETGDEPGGEPEPETPPEPTPEDPFAGIDEELLADEERVLRLLEANGGRMKQADIVSETGWSNAKVSQLLSSMDEDGDIDKLRIGRENLISLPDVDVGEVE
jgi:hypothetical protein